MSGPLFFSSGRAPPPGWLRRGQNGADPQTGGACFRVLVAAPLGLRGAALAAASAAPTERGERLVFTIEHDRGPGSLRAAVMAEGPRTILVGGVRAPRLQGI
mgnify:CR=1 FL=1